MVRVVRVIGWWGRSGWLGHELADHPTQLICIWIFICISMYYLKCNISDMTTENNLKQNTLYSRDIIDFQFFSEFKILLSWCWFFYLLNTLHLIWAFSCCMVGWLCLFFYILIYFFCDIIPSSWALSCWFVRFKKLISSPCFFSSP